MTKEMITKRIEELYWERAEVREGGEEEMEEQVKDYIGLGFYVVKRTIPVDLRIFLVSIGLGEDLRQEIYLLSLGAERKNLYLKEASNYIQRGLYHFLRAYGFRRARGYSGYINDYFEGGDRND